MTDRIGVIDLFAGPGGLGEGFSAFCAANGDTPFEMALSIEKDEAAHATLRLRAFIRAYRRRHAGRLPRAYVDHALSGDERTFRLSQLPSWSELDESAWNEAEAEALRCTLGLRADETAIRAATERVGRAGYRDLVLIGGPPCQAYSLVGRARNRGIVGYELANDERVFLFREYLAILDRLRPAVFIMENVRGLLSSRVEQQGVFETLMNQVEGLGGRSQKYELVPLSAPARQEGLFVERKPSDFLVRAEEHGVPQRRHRVILVGVRRDVAQVMRLRMGTLPGLAPSNHRPTVSDVIGGMPALRSGLSKERDSSDAWAAAIREIAAWVRDLPQTDEIDLPGDLGDAFLKEVETAVLDSAPLPRSCSRQGMPSPRMSAALSEWLLSEQLHGSAQHATRAHQRSDLARYFFAAVFARAAGRSPRARDFPRTLAPAHRNWGSGIFDDRFRVQLENEPSTTIVSHLHKDGHAFIHPDPVQCRSLTPREAARLQTFPDDYLFVGNRTQQFLQVGNAVPPFLALQVARVVHDLMEMRDRECDPSVQAGAAVG